MKNFVINIIKYVFRGFIILCIVILGKSLFVCYIDGTLTLDGLLANIYSFSSILLSIGYILTNLTSNLLDKTPLKVNISKDILSYLGTLVKYPWFQTIGGDNPIDSSINDTCLATKGEASGSTDKGKKPLTIEDDGTVDKSATPKSNKNNAPFSQEGSSSIDPQKINSLDNSRYIGLSREQYIDFIAQMSILSSRFVESTEVLSNDIKGLSRHLETHGRNLPDNAKLTSMSEGEFLKLLHKNSHILGAYTSNRAAWMHAHRALLSDVDRAKLDEILENGKNIHKNYLEKAQKISQLDSTQTQVKTFYGELNHYRSRILKELNKADSIIWDNLKTSPMAERPELKNEYADIKKIFNIEYTEAKKNFIKHDNYLKKRIGEIINEPKK